MKTGGTEQPKRKRSLQSNPGDICLLLTLMILETLCYKNIQISTVLLEDIYQQ
jgi:hypothetical protein